MIRHAWHGVEYLLDWWGVVALSVEQEIDSTLFSCRRPKRQRAMATQHDFHIGQMIKAVFDESGMTVAEFARQIHLERSTVYGIFERPSLDSMLLARISLVLGHNFLSDVEEHYGLKAKTNSFTFHLDHISPELAHRLTALLNETAAF